MSETDLVERLDEAKGRNDEIIVLAMAGMSFSGIAQSLEISRNTVAGVVCHHRDKQKRAAES